MSKLPFSTEDGYFNGDMFEDWYMNDPSEEDTKLWNFLHNWENSMREKITNDIFQQLKMKIEALDE